MYRGADTCFLPTQDESLGDKARNAYEDAKKAVGNATETAKEKISGAADELQGAGEDVADKT